MTRIVAITSGKGGVGKTNLSVNLALHLAASGSRTCLFDADLGLANVNILLGLNPEHTLDDVLFHGKDLRDVVIRDHRGIDLIPGSSGVERMANLNGEDADRLIRSFAQMSEYDFFLLDTSAGISRNVLCFCLALQEVILVITPEPTSLTDAYALLKVLYRNGFRGSVRTVVNLCPDLQTAKLIYAKFQQSVRKFIPIRIQPLGVLLQDPSVIDAVRNQKAFIHLHPDANASKCIRHIAKTLLDAESEAADRIDMTSFWTKWFDLIHSPMQFLDSTGSERGDLRPAVRDPAGPHPPGSPREAGGTVGGAREKNGSANFVGRDRSSPDRDSGVPLGPLIEGIQSLTSEIRLLRETLRDGGTQAAPVSVWPENGGPNAWGSKSISLDFDSFLRGYQDDARVRE
jgi:flagellar biosynthesis protein FlhG